MKHSNPEREHTSNGRVAIVAALLTVALVVPENAHAFESVKFAIREICGHMEGNLGGLLMTVSAVGGLAAAAMGNLRAMQSMIITGIGAATVSTFLSLYFDAAAKECRGRGKGIDTGQPGERSREVNSSFTLGDPATLRATTLGDGPDLDAPADNTRGGLNTDSLNTALDREVDFSKAATATQGADEGDDGAFDQDFSDEGEGTGDEF